MHGRGLPLPDQRVGRRLMISVEYVRVAGRPLISVVYVRASCRVGQELARVQREHAVDKRAWDRERQDLVSQLAASS